MYVETHLASDMGTQSITLNRSTTSHPNPVLRLFAVQKIDKGEIEEYYNWSQDYERHENGAKQFKDTYQRCDLDEYRNFSEVIKCVIGEYHRKWWKWS